MSELEDPMDKPIVPLESLDEGQLRDLILQAFGLLAIREGVSLLDVVAECYQEVEIEVRANGGENGG